MSPRSRTAIAVPMAAALVGALLPFFPLLATGGAAAVLGVGLLSGREETHREDLHLLVWTVMAVAGLLDLTRGVRFGSITFSGAVTAALSVIALWMLVRDSRNIQAAGGPAALFLLWIGWSSVTLAWYRPTESSFANLGIYALFAAELAVVAARARSREDVGRLVERAMLAAAGIASGLFAFGLVTGGLVPGFVAPRLFATVALLGLAWALAAWRYGSKRAGWLAAGLVGLVFISLSRTALVAALLMVPLAWFRPWNLRSTIRLLAMGALVIVAFLFAISRFTPLQERFTVGDVESVGQGVFGQGLRINVNGRNEVWQAVWEDYRRSPWIGLGVGSGDDFVRVAFPKQVEVLGHPHNDYLRLLHDAGMVGAALWLMGMAWALLRIFLGWVRADRAGHRDARLHLAAMLGAVALLASMTTDNTLIYVWFMGPFGILLGAALGRAAATAPARSSAVRGAEESMAHTRPVGSAGPPPHALGPAKRTDHAG